MWFTTSTWLNIYRIWNTPHLARPWLRETGREREGRCEKVAFSVSFQFRAMPLKYDDFFFFPVIHNQGEFLIVVIILCLSHSWVYAQQRAARTGLPSNSCLEKYARATDSIRYSQHPIIIITIIPFIYETWKRFYGVEKIWNRILKRIFYGGKRKRFFFFACLCFVFFFFSGTELQLMRIIWVFDENEWRTVHRNRKSTPHWHNENQLKWNTKYFSTINWYSLWRFGPYSFPSIENSKLLLICWEELPSPQMKVISVSSCTTACPLCNTKNDSDNWIVRSKAQVSPDSRLSHISSSLPFPPNYSRYL